MVKNWTKKEACSICSCIKNSKEPMDIKTLEFLVSLFKLIEGEDY